MSHHAIVVEGSLEEVNDLLVKHPQSESSEKTFFPYTSVGVNEVRQLVVEAQLTPGEGESRLVVVEVKSITLEAQNALLKLLEEPPFRTRFFFVTRPGVSLIPTLRSRFLSVQNKNITENNPAFSEFVKMGLAERLDIVSDKIENKDDLWFSHIRSGLENYLSKNLKNNISSVDMVGHNLILSRLDTRGASNKMLLEELALSLPVDAS